MEKLIKQYAASQKKEIYNKISLLSKIRENISSKILDLEKELAVVENTKNRMLKDSQTSKKDIQK